MRLTKTLLACALTAAALPSFADKTITFEAVGDNLPATQPAFLGNGDFGLKSINGGGLWMLSSSKIGCDAGGTINEFQTHQAGFGFDAGGCGAVNLTSPLDDDGLPTLTKLVIGVSAADAFNSFEFWWSEKRGTFSVSFLNGDGQVIATGTNPYGGTDDTVNGVAYANWHYENVDLKLQTGDLARFVVFDYGNSYNAGMIDDLRFKNVQGGGTVPEPTSYALVLAALGGVAFARRRNKKA